MTRRHKDQEWMKNQIPKTLTLLGFDKLTSCTVVRGSCLAKEPFFLYQYTTYPYYYLVLVHPQDQHVVVKFDMLEIQDYIESTYIFAANFVEANFKGDVNGS